MRIRNVLVVACVCAAFVVCNAIISNAAGANDLAAKVNGIGIKTVSLDAAVSNFIENQKLFGVTIKDEDKGKLRKDILDQLIAAELLYQKSQNVGLGDLTKKVDEELANIKKGFSSEDEFNKALKEKGISLNNLKEDIKKGVYINAFLEKDVFPKLTSVSEDEKTKEYEKNKDKLNVPDEVKASHILIKVDEKASDADKQAAKDKIDALRQRALGGEDFANLAKENSQDASAKNGGDLGYFRKGEMVKPFEDAAFGLEKDKISDVIETQFGYHILKVLDKKPARTLSYEEVQNDIAKFLENNKKRDAVNQVVEDMKKTAKIETY